MAACEGCRKELTHGNTTGLCYVCSSALAHDQHELIERELPAFLGLEAEFVAWCAAHGYPNPHD